MQIKEFAEFTGVSVRTLHYYDEIGLLKPAFVDEHTHYRYYDKSSVLRMQEILFFRELDFSLKSIREILSSPNYNKNEALKEQKHLLILKKERLERLISAIDSAVKGELVMQSFDNTEFQTYAAEAEERWGDTAAYKEYSKKTKSNSQEQWQGMTEGMNAIFEQFALCVKNGEEVSSDTAQSLVKKLQIFITENYYTCTNEILAALGQMYIFDERFKNNIDKFGEGTALFVSEAIKVYCKA